MTGSRMKYRGFISYSHADTRVATRLHRWLESYRLPRRLVGRATPFGPVPARLGPVFRDREELPTSADLGGQIQAALEESATLVVICSPRAAASRWVNEEILAFKRLGRGDRILCLIVDGEPNATLTPGRADDECFPPALRFQLGVDGNLSDVPAEPIAADIRPGGDGHRDAFLKLAAGLAGVGFDDLRQRELQRQVRRAIAAAVASLVLVAVMGGLAVAALFARREAVRQQVIAERERDRAEDNFREARGAVDRFYRKIADEDLLKAEGLQPLRQDLLRQALDYYRRFLDQRVDDPTFAADVAEVQGNVAAILVEAGDPVEAQAAARRATEALAVLHAAGPGTPQLTERLAESLATEAVALDRVGRTSEALERQTRAIELQESLPATAPRRAAGGDVRLWSNRGAYEARLGRLEDAVRSYERSLESAAAGEPSAMAPLGCALEAGDAGVVVVGISPGSPAHAAGMQIGDVIGSIAGSGIHGLDDVARVRGGLVAGVAVPVTVVRGDNHADLEITPVRFGDFMTATTYYNLGYLLLERLHDPGRARQPLERAVDEYRRALLRQSSAAPEIRQGLAFAAGVLGTCGLRLGDAQLFERGIREAASVAEENVRANPDVPAFRSLAGVNLTNLSSLLLRQDRLAEASQACEAAVGHFRRAIETGGNRMEDRTHLVQALSNLAMMRGEQDGPETALPIYESAVAAVEGIPEGDGPQVVAFRARLCRNFAASLRKADRLDESARQYGLAADLYGRAAAATDVKVRGALREEAAQMAPWHAAVEARRGDTVARSRIAVAFEETCRALAEAEGGKEAVLRLHAAAVEAWCDAATRAADADRGAAFLSVARGELERAERLADDDEGLRPALEAMRAAVERTERSEPVGGSE